MNQWRSRARRFLCYAGAITAVFREAAEREAAFRFVENHRFSYAEVAL